MSDVQRTTIQLTDVTGGFFTLTVGLRDPHRICSLSAYASVDELAAALEKIPVLAGKVTVNIHERRQDDRIFGGRAWDVTVDADSSDESTVIWIDHRGDGTRLRGPSCPGLTLAYEYEVPR